MILRNHENVICMALPSHNDTISTLFLAAKQNYLEGLHLYMFYFPLYFFLSSYLLINSFHVQLEWIRLADSSVSESLVKLLGRILAHLGATAYSEHH
jgi:hypothetical protein